MKQAPPSRPFLFHELRESRFLAAAIATISAVMGAFDRASAQTAFNFPAPPFELPVLPPASACGSKTRSVGLSP